MQYTNRGVTWLAGRRGTEALRDLSASEEILRRVLGPTSWDTLTAQFNGAIALAYLGRIEEARAALRLVREGSPHVANRMWALYVVGVVERLAGDARAALRAQEESFALIAEGPRAPWNRLRSLRGEGPRPGRARRSRGGRGAAAARARALRGAAHGDAPARARRSWSDSAACTWRGVSRIGRCRCSKRRTASGAPSTPETGGAGESALWLGRCYTALGRAGDARPALARAGRIVTVPACEAATGSPGRVRLPPLTVTRRLDGLNVKPARRGVSV